MALSIRTNIASLNAQRNLSSSQTASETAMAHLSSGMRITKAGDDAAGLAISSKLQADIRGFNQAARNANDGLSLIQTAESALNTTTNILTRLKELAVQSSSDGISDTERGYVDTEAQKLVEELDRIANSTKYNGTALLDGSQTDLQFQVGIGDDTDTDSRIVIDLTNQDATSATLFGGNTIDLSDRDAAQANIADINSALDLVATARSELGAAGNRFQSVVENIQTFAESLSAANSRIRDVDVAEETSAMARSSVLMQAGISVLAQANQQPQMALKLLG